MAIKVEMAPSHPGNVIKTLILPEDMTITKAAKLLKVSRQSLDALVNERRSISPEMALRIEAVFGGKAQMLVSLQKRFDLYKARQDPNITKGLKPHSTHPSLTKTKAA